MAPKASEQADTPSTLPAKKGRAVPMTTQDKIAAAEASQARVTAAATKRASKPRTLPPPGEAFRVHKPKATKGESKPLTTKGKTRAANAAKRKEEATEKKRLAEEKASGTSGTTENPSKSTSEARMDLFGAVMGYNKTSLQYTTKKSGLRVTERPTERTRRIQQQQQRTISTGPETMNTRDQPSRVSITNLDEEIRRRIWEFCVVFPNFCIWPNSPTGKEQPDLAMTCKSIRAEVLPIYYAKNVFAIDITPDAHGKQTTNLGSIQKWTRCLEPGPFGMIRQWALSYTPTTSSSVPLAEKRQLEQENSFVISLKFTENSQGRSRRSWDASVEIHRFASCILPGSDEYDQCVIQTTPQWLQNEVIKVINAADGGAIPANTIVGLARIAGVKGISGDHKCEKVLGSIEVGQKF